jgi:hypothetical protein
MALISHSAVLQVYLVIIVCVEADPDLPSARPRLPRIRLQMVWNRPADPDVTRPYTRLEARRRRQAKWDVPIIWHPGDIFPPVNIPLATFFDHDNYPSYRPLNDIVHITSASMGLWSEELAQTWSTQQAKRVQMDNEADRLCMGRMH